MFLLTASAGVNLLPAQTANPAPAAPAPATAPAVPAPPPAKVATDNTGAGAATSTALDYLYHQKGASGSEFQVIQQAQQAKIQQQIARDAVGDTMADAKIKTRFEKFLGMKEISTEEINAYNGDMAQFHAYLADKKTVDAWKQLLKLATYEALDAGFSMTLANQISSIWDAGNTTKNIAAQNQHLAEDMADHAYTADEMTEAYHEQQNQLQIGKANSNQQQQQPQQQQSTTTGNTQNVNVLPDVPTPTAPQAMPSSVAGRLQLTDEYVANITDEATILWNQKKAAKLVENTKKDFVAYIKTLNQNKYYREVVMASDFYLALFDEGEYPVELQGYVDTARAANRDEDNIIEVFKDKITNNEVAAATDQLEIAFMQDEYHPALLGVPRDMKRKVEIFIKDLDKMENIIEAKDYASLDPLLADMKTLAPDFDATKANSLVSAVKMQSKMHLGSANLAAQMGDKETAMAEFQAAAEAWPGNPDLDLLSKKYFDTSGTINQTVAEFDRLVKDNNYRQIAANAPLIAAAVNGDKDRVDQLTAKLATFKLAETALETANGRVAMGDVIGAWETIELALHNTDLQDDNKLNSMRGQLAGKAAEFVSAINKAEDAEGRSELGYSLTWYAIAQRKYPGSKIANDAIERISKQILDKASI